MRKLITLLAIICMTSSAIAQNYGTLRGLSYRHDFQKDFENDMRLNELQQAEVQHKYKQIQELYKYQTEHNDVTDGWHTVVATDGSSLFDSRSVYVSNGAVTVYKNGAGDSMLISSGGKIIDEKTIIALKENNNIIELYFGFKLQ